MLRKLFGSLFFRLALLVVTVVITTQLFTIWLASNERHKLLERQLYIQVLDTLLIPRVIAHFTDAHPGIGIRVERLWQSDIESAVKSGDLDLGICLDPPKIQGVVLDIFAETPFVVVVADKDPLAGRRSLGVVELGQVPLILFPQRASWLRQLTDETLSAARIEPTCSIEMDSIEAIIATVEQGLGVAFLPIAVLVIAGLLLDKLALGFLVTAHGWVATAVSVAIGLCVTAGLVLLVAPTTSLVASFFFDEVSRIVGQARPPNKSEVVSLLGSQPIKSTFLPCCAIM